MPKRASSSITHAELPWTASRCLRLLRPLTTRLNAFHDLAGGPEQATTHKTSRVPQQKRKAKSGDVGRTQDFEWGSSHAPKRVKTTYGARREAAARSDTTVRPRDSERKTPQGELGSFNVPTPILRRQIRDADTVSTDNAMTPSRKKSNMSPPPKPKMDKTRRGELSLQLFRDFDNIITQTCPPIGEKPPRTGTKGASSLLEMCLKNVPAYIANEEEWQEADDADEVKTNVATDTYSMLEDLGHGTEGGWHQLRTVVQAHAIFSIRQAIEREDFEMVRDVSPLIDICWQMRLHVEVRSLFCSCIKTPGRFPPPTLSKRPGANFDEACFVPSSSAKASVQPMKLDPHEFWEVARSGTNYKQINRGYVLMRIAHLSAEMLRSDKLPVEWLSCPHFRPIWQNVIQSLSAGDIHHHISMDFVEQFLRSASALQVPDSRQSSSFVNQGYRSPTVQDASMRTLTSLLAMLCAIGLVEKSGSENIQQLRRTERPLVTVGLEIGQALLEENIDDIDEHTIVSRMLILVGELILCQGDADAQAQISLRDDVQFEKRLVQLSTLNHALGCRDSAENAGLEHVSNLLCAISRCYARATSSNALDIMRGILDNLMQPQAARLRSCIRFVNRLALDTAMLFSEETPSREASAYVHTLETLKSSGSRRIPSTTRNVPEESPATTGKPGLRWEPGISEWIASTPASLVRLKRMSLENTSQNGNTVLSDVVDSIKRPAVCSYQPFAVVIPPMPLSSSPTKPGRGLADTNVNKQHPRNTARPIVGALEDSGIFLESDAAGGLVAPEDEYEDVEAGAKTRKTALNNSEQSVGWATTLKRAHDEQKAEERDRKELKRKLRDAAAALNPFSTSPAPSMRARRQHAARPAITALGKTMPRASPPGALIQDESEDELSMLSTDSQAGAAEAAASSSFRAVPLLGQAVSERPTKRRRAKR